MENTKKSKIKWDIILVAAILAVALIVAAILLFTSDKGKQVKVSVDGEVAATFPLDQDRTYTITGANGGTNLLVIQGGEACISEADCPDALCVNMGKISRSGQSVICLPHKVVVEITGEENDDVDVIVD